MSESAKQREYEQEKARRLEAIKQVESGGEKDPYKATNPHSSASGAYQFTDATWKDAGGSTKSAKEATKKEQDSVASKHYDHAYKATGSHQAATRAWNVGISGAKKDESKGKEYLEKVERKMQK